VPAPAKEGGAGWNVPALTDEEFERFRRLVYDETGIHLRHTKRYLLVARLFQRIRQLGLETFSEYYEFLLADRSGQERTRFINRITTNKTSFFREPHHFEYLRSHVIAKARHRRLRIWSAACSSGEEPYSIAITMREAEADADDWDVRILASDIDTDMLDQAQSGVYHEEALAGVRQCRPHLHFLKGYGDRQGLVQVRPEVRRMIEFRHINLIAPEWPAPGPFDTIFCRNVLIYFDAATQRRIVERLVRALKPDGCLFVGHSENLYSLRDLVVCAGQTVYRPAAGVSQ
jgi:chemotaxis protein methyltransferase CheR